MSDVYATFPRMVGFASLVGFGFSNFAMMDMHLHARAQSAKLQIDHDVEKVLHVVSAHKSATKQSLSDIH